MNATFQRHAYGEDLTRSRKGSGKSTAEFKKDITLEYCGKPEVLSYRVPDRCGNDRIRIEKNRPLDNIDIIPNGSTLDDWWIGKVARSDENIPFMTEAGCVTNSGKDVDALA